MEKLKNPILEKLDAFFDIVEDFQDLLKEENEALVAYDLQKIAQIYPQKMKLVTAYRSLTGFFIQNKDCIKDLNEVQKEDLREISLELDALLKENETLLKTRMETSKLVMSSIVSIAKVTSRSSNATSYGAKGSFSPLNNNYNALAINRTL